jgi:asparagine synthetase B (glutamine-hydrolysing)
LCFGAVDAQLPAVPRMTPLEALEQAVLPALRRSPCLVAFSGGRDSSAVFAVAASTARRHGLDPPIPATLRFTAAPLAQEAEWQETVVRHLGAEDWIRLDIGDELEYLGPIGTRILRRHGVLWPPNAYLTVPLLERAGRGSVLNGDGGDEFVNGGAHGRIRGVASRRVAPEPQDIRRLLAALAPPPIRRAARMRTSRYRIPWLRPGAQREALRAAVRDIECEPVRFDSRVRWLARRRSTVEALRTGQRLAADTDASLVAPLLDTRFVASLASAGGPLGWSSRLDVMRSLFGELLPEAVLARSTKAGFSEVVWGPRTRQFASGWSGEGLDPELVDPDALRAAWSESIPTFPAGVPLQAAWLGHARLAKNP